MLARWIVSTTVIATFACGNSVPAGEVQFVGDDGKVHASIDGAGSSHTTEGAGELHVDDVTGELAIDGPGTHQRLKFADDTALYDPKLGVHNPFVTRDGDRYTIPALHQVVDLGTSGKISSGGRFAGYGSSVAQHRRVMALLLVLQIPTDR